jgi:hypothetical protein
VGFSAAILLPRIQFFADYPQPFDQAMWFTIVLVTCTPTANNLVVMADLISSEMEDAIEESPQLKEAGIVTPAQAVAGSLKVQYLLSPLALTGSLSAALIFLSSASPPQMIPIVPDV